MFSKQHVEGILLALSKPEILIQVSETTQIGYKVRLRLNVRAESYAFLEALNRSLLQHNVKGNLKEKEHSHRQKPILRIGGIKNLDTVCRLVNPDLPDAKKSWDSFRKAVEIVGAREHLELEGIEKLLKIKGVL
tara:strand:+ start:1087 stop:1488 length:402 start_codon:yes stop_codon:yes gene_type:complete